METGIKELIDLWDSDEGKPYAGKLIDMDSFDPHDPFAPGCMCAQGDVLTRIGGMHPLDLRGLIQTAADRETARVLNISIAHSILLRFVNDRSEGAPSVVLTDPGRVLGDGWSSVLDLWEFFEHFDWEDWFTDHFDWRDSSGGLAAIARVVRTVKSTIAFETEYAVRATARDLRWDLSAECAVWELLQQVESPFFLPLFGFASADEIPPRPSGYGHGVVPGGGIMVRLKGE